jgi:hypothetical protein
MTLSNAALYLGWIDSTIIAADPVSGRSGFRGVSHFSPRLLPRMRLSPECANELGQVGPRLQVGHLPNQCSPLRADSGYPQGA